ncbi:hypothetical protein FJT64_025610 [Amphibalanus amphitrite]|uniref:Uncharacterized protein n=1 Tax=Amphibalanus amphitrite TaxID=1232801 RepID=A0A6A4WHS4_AMPAM|nr:hypothetical protein FJT64_025610 [Amphibalanus amphitrite]
MTLGLRFGLSVIGGSSQIAWAFTLFSSPPAATHREAPDVSAILSEVAELRQRARRSPDPAEPSSTASWRHQRSASPGSEETARQVPSRPPDLPRSRPAEQPRSLGESIGLRVESALERLLTSGGVPASPKASPRGQRAAAPNTRVAASELVRRTLASSGTTGQQRTSTHVTTNVTERARRGRDGKDGVKRIVTKTEVITGAGLKPTKERHFVHGQKVRTHRAQHADKSAKV